MVHRIFGEIKCHDTLKERRENPPCRCGFSRTTGSANDSDLRAALVLRRQGLHWPLFVRLKPHLQGCGKHEESYPLKQTKEPTALQFFLAALQLGGIALRAR